MSTVVDGLGGDVVEGEGAVVEGDDGRGCAAGTEVGVGSVVVGATVVVVVLVVGVVATGATAPGTR